MREGSSFKSMVFPMGRSKKGMIFTIMVTAIVILLIYNYINAQGKPASTNIESISARVDSMNKFVKDTSYDLDRATYIAGYRALLGINEYVTTTGKPVSKNSFREAIIYGTINGTYINITSKDNLDDWRSSITILGRELFVNTSVEFSDVDVYQDSPWYVSFRVHARMRFKDLMNTSYFDVNATGTSRISIMNFEDPSISIYTNGTSINVINKSRYSLEELKYDGTSQRLSRIKDFFTSQAYVANEIAPDYLGRLTGNSSGSAYGIESVIDINHLQSDFIYNTTNIDFLYFRRNVSSSRIDIPGVSWIRLDSRHIAAFNLSERVIPG